MEQITLILFGVTVGLFVLRYYVKKEGLDYLGAVVSVCALMAVLQDKTLGDQILLMLVPGFYLVMMNFIHIAFGKTNKDYW